MLKFLSLVSALLVALSPAPAAQVPAPDPSQGDGGVSAFYTWEGAIPTRPGTLLRFEPLPATSELPEAGRQLRILYSSTDGVDGASPVAVSGALFVPRGSPPAGGWPLMAWAHGTTGLADVCAPSWMPRDTNDSRYFRDTFFLNAWLHAGFAVVATDYQGLGVPGPHPYVNMRANAYSLLDSVRAVQGQAFDLASPIVLAGWSQGGGTALAATGYAPHYAPELDVRGTVLTGVPNLSESSMKSGMTSAKTGVTPLLYIAMQARQLHPDLKPEEIFTGEGLRLFDAARRLCLSELRSAVAAAGATPETAVQPGMGQRLFETDLAQKLYPTLKLSRPLFVGIGGADLSVAPETQLMLVKQLCEAGTIVEAHLYAGQGHVEGMDASSPDAIAFARKVYVGGSPTPDCDP